jgi:hypothetical protein
MIKQESTLPEMKTSRIIPFQNQDGSAKAVGGRRPIDERAATRQYNEYSKAPHSGADSGEAVK